MKIGASTSCFYPLETELSLNEVIKLGFDRVEIFFNAPQELEDNFVKELKANADANGVKIVSAHPFSSFLESNCIFTEYQRRYDYFIDLYKKHCHATALLGADIAVIHGAVERAKRPIPAEMYFERFAKLIEIGKAEGVQVCQENVNLFRSQTIDFCKQMRDYLGDDFKMVFDIKQAVRAGFDPMAFAQEFKQQIAHIHISDHCADMDCMPPGRGNFDFQKLFDLMSGAGYNGSYIIEIYSKGYNVEKELAFSKKYFETL